MAIKWQESSFFIFFIFFIFSSLTLVLYFFAVRNINCQIGICILMTDSGVCIKSWLKNKNKWSRFYLSPWDNAVLVSAHTFQFLTNLSFPPQLYLPCYTFTISFSCTHQHLKLVIHRDRSIADLNSSKLNSRWPHINLCITYNFLHINVRLQHRAVMSDKSRDERVVEFREKCMKKGVPLV